MGRDTVQYVLLAVAVLLIAFDVYLSMDGIHGNTISEVTWGLAAKSPILPFLAGVLAGHLFWRK